MAHGIFVFGRLILVNLPNLLTTAAIVAFRTTAWTTLFLGIGFCKSLLLLRPSVVRRSVDLALKTSLVGASIYVSMFIFGYYHSVWERVVQNPQVRQACTLNRRDFYFELPLLSPI